MLTVSHKLLNAQFALGDAGTTPRSFRYSGSLKSVHTIEWGEGTQVGEVTIEAADREDYDGTWKEIQVVSFSGTAPKVDTVAVGDAHGAFRHRITVPTNNGATVTSRVRGGL